jgi:hypothetical protein
MGNYADLYLAHRLFGGPPAPISSAQFLEAQAGVRIFEIGGFVTHRNAEKFASFSWVNEPMGLVYPSEDTWFTAPRERGLLGSIAVKGAKDTQPKLEAKGVSRLKVPGVEGDGGFAFVGQFARSGGAIEQRLAMISLPGTPVLYAERLRALQEVDVVEVATGTVAVLNEDARPISQNERRIWTAEGEVRVRGAVQEKARRHVWKTDWASIDGRLGIVARASGRMAYDEDHEYQRGRLQQILSANHREGVGVKRAGEKFSEAAVAFIPEAARDRQYVLRVEESTEEGMLVQLEGWRIAINLSASEMRIRTPAGEAVLAPWTAAVERASQ